MATAVGSPCAACKFLRRKCTSECVFAPYFPPEDPHKFANVHKVFGASNVSKLLNELPLRAREDTVNSLAYEADARVKDPVYGCVGAISILQCRVAQLQAELAVALSELVRLKGLINDHYNPPYPLVSPNQTPPNSHQVNSPSNLAQSLHQVYPSSSTPSFSINPTLVSATPSFSNPAHASTSSTFVNPTPSNFANPIPSTFASPTHSSSSCISNPIDSSSPSFSNTTHASIPSFSNLTHASAPSSFSDPADSIFTLPDRTSTVRQTADMHSGVRHTGGLHSFSNPADSNFTIPDRNSRDRQRSGDMHNGVRHTDADRYARRVATSVPMGIPHLPQNLASKHHDSNASVTYNTRTSSSLNMGQFKLEPQS